MKKIQKQKLHLGREVVKSLVTELETDKLGGVGGAGAKTNAGTCGGSRLAFMCRSIPDWACNIVTEIG